MYDCLFVYVFLYLALPCLTLPYLALPRLSSEVGKYKLSLGYVNTLIHEFAKPMQNPAWLPSGRGFWLKDSG